MLHRSAFFVDNIETILHIKKQYKARLYKNDTRGDSANLPEPAGRLPDQPAGTTN